MKFSFFFAFFFTFP
ncbi:hypothetical protein ACQE32_17970 [Pantoea sp. FN0302]